ncbi:MAG: hypothetical protein QXG03_12445 [Halalkalicoccus sp.]
MKAHESNPYRAEVVVRSLAPHGVNDRQRTIIQQVERCRERGVLTDVDVEVWGREIGADPDVRTVAHDRYDAIETWADNRGYTLAPGFGRQHRESIVDDDPEEVISFPLICLVVYAVDERSREEAVRAVFPCSDGEETYTIVDGIEALEERTPVESRPEAGEGSDARSDAESPSTDSGGRKAIIGRP